VEVLWTDSGNPAIGVSSFRENSAAEQAYGLGSLTGQRDLLKNWHDLWILSLYPWFRKRIDHYYAKLFLDLRDSDFLSTRHCIR
jgi:hypothetical protein